MQKLSEPDWFQENMNKHVLFKNLWEHRKIMNSMSYSFETNPETNLTPKTKREWDENKHPDFRVFEYLLRSWLIWQFP